MCGIFGLIDFKKASVRPELLNKMGKTLIHRGPDDGGAVLFKKDRSVELRTITPYPSSEGFFEVGLGHRRLSIIDLSDLAHQPMGNEDKTLWIVFNGEIYNFLSLRKELEERGHHFISNSDTEVILHAYEEWGVECLQGFRGMFAFAIWDSKLRRLFIARDRLGEKPLVYLNVNGLFAFASELKALLQIPGIGRKVNDRALHHYLTFQYVPSPDTIFKDIQKLPPAHYLILDASGNIKVERYWKLRFTPMPEEKVSRTEICQRIREQMEESVKLRLISDVPLGAFLSGGMDSSLIVGIMAKLSRTPVKTFSIGFEEKDFNELPYARMVSEHFSTEHHEFIVKPDAMGILPKLVWHFNEPFADSSAIPTYYVANLTKDYVKVVLTGDAGDENFAGYPRYLRSKWVSQFIKLPQRFRKDLMPPILRTLASFKARKMTLNRLADFIEQLSDHRGRNYSEQIKIFNEGEKKELYSDEFSDAVQGEDSIHYLIGKIEEAETENLIDQLLYLDINTYLPEDLLVKMDIATMANSLEARTPFLDHPFMEYVATIPSSLKLKGNISKYVLKEAFSDFLPKEILNRRKMGFAVPVSRWFRKEMKDQIFEILLDRHSLGRGYFRREGIERLLSDHLACRYDHSAKIWALLVLEMWFRTFVDRRGRDVEYGV